MFERVAAARLVVVAFMQQSLVERHPRFGERTLVTLQALLRVDEVERTGDVCDPAVALLQQ